MSVGSPGEERQKRRATSKYTKDCQMENGIYIYSVWAEDPLETSLPHESWESQYLLSKEVRKSLMGDKAIEQIPEKSDIEGLKSE